MSRMTKRQFEQMFREEVMPHLVEHEREGFPDKPRRREAWNNTIDAYIRDGVLSEAAGNWGHPRWLETWSPRGGPRHATMKAKFSNRQIGGYLQAAREPMGISFNDSYNKATYGITKADFDEINRAMHAHYGMFPERTLAGVRKALAGDGGRHHATKKSAAQLDREIAEALASRSGLSRHHRDLLARRGPGGGLRAGHLTPAGWHGDPMAIEDRRLRLEALREQPAPTFPKAPATGHATKRSTQRSAWPSVVGSHDLGTADVRTEQGAYWIVTKPTGYRVDYKPWGPSSEVDLGTFPSRKHAREKIAEHALSVGATVRHHATKKTAHRGAPKFHKFDERSKSDWFPLWKFREMIVDGRVFDEDGSGRYGKLDDRGQKVVSNYKVDLARFATPHSFDRHVPSWATGVVWSSSRPRVAHATRGRGSKKEVTYRGYTYNLRSAYDRGYYDALRGVRAQEQDPDYTTGYASGQHAPYLRR